MSELEKEYTQRVLKAAKGNESEPTRILGINRASLWRKLTQFEEETGRG